ncbi:hypothetical protein J437_LFUL003299 [Ladona fulva]|uniref:DDE-1 domain-containing protein n=1 Tax=Ladona fulva TaxID=123851 RepID=A0A8K0P6A9_LADFU|nr:hypothetical protein J437_LFUL003299 [Ladona fulva]
MPCANVTRKHKLPLFVVGTAKKSGAFKSVMLPICYCGQKNAWVTRELFLEWFKAELVPAVQQHVKSVNLPQRALLLLDNCPGHPSAEELCTDDEITVAIGHSKCRNRLNSGAARKMDILEELHLYGTIQSADP